MFPESFVEEWVEKLTMPGDTVLDPFCGRGTTPFQSALMKRRAVATDVNPVAFCITKAKTNAVSRNTVVRRLVTLQSDYVPHDWESLRRSLPRFFRLAYTPETLRQILYLRSSLRWRTVRSDCMVAAIALGALHGESHKSPFYFSNQMPRTISTKPNYSIRYWQRHGMKAPKRDVFSILRNKINFRYESLPPSEKCLVLNLDMRDLPSRKQDFPGLISCAITSPPYLDITNYEEDQWLRLWFLGGPPHPTYKTHSKDDRLVNRTAYRKMIGEMWHMFGKVLAKNSNIVVRLGGKNLTSDEIVAGLKDSSKSAQRNVLLRHYSVSPLSSEKQTRSFLPSANGCSFEVDCHFTMA